MEPFLRILAWKPTTAEVVHFSTEAFRSIAPSKQWYLDILANTLCSISHLNISIYCYILYICVVFLSISFQHKRIKSQKLGVGQLFQVPHLWPIPCDELGLLLGILYMILLMVQKSGLHQLRLIVYAIIYRVFYIPDGAGFQPSTVVLVIHLVISRKFSLVSYDPHYPIMKLGFQILKEYFAAKLETMTSKSIESLRKRNQVLVP